MKKIFSILIVLLLVGAPFAAAKGVISNGVILTYDREGIRLFESYADSKREGILLHYFTNGEVGKIFPYHNNELDGFAVGYYPNQQVQYRIYFQDGIRNGPARSFYLNGQVAVELNYRDGKPDGVAKFYNEHGVLEKVALYSWGKLLRAGYCDSQGKIVRVTE